MSKITELPLSDTHHSADPFNKDPQLYSEEKRETNHILTPKQKKKKTLFFWLEARKKVADSFHLNSAPHIHTQAIRYYTRKAT